MTEVHKLLKLKAFVLRVVEEEGWNVLAKILKPTSSEKDEFKELLTEARKQAKLFEGCPTSYGLAYQNSYNKQTTKQFNYYFCRSAGHMAAICPSKSTKGNSLGNRFFQNKENMKGDYAQEKVENRIMIMINADQNREIVGRINESAAVKYWMEKIKPPLVVFCSSLEQEQPNTIKKNKVLQTDCRHRKGTSDYTSTKARRNKSLFEGTVRNKLGNSQTVGKSHRQDSEPSESLCPSTNKMFEVLLSYRCGKSPKLKIRRKNQSCRAGKNRRLLMPQQLDGAQNWMVKQHLAIGQKESKSTFAWTSEFHKYAERFLGLGVYRQSYGSSNNKFWRKMLVAKGSLQKLVASLSGKGYLDLQDKMEEVFQQIDAMFGPYSIDRMALHLNTKMRKQNQLCLPSLTPGTEAKSEKYWNLYKEFCKKFDLDVENPLEEGKEGFKKSLAIAQVLRTIRKEFSKDKTPDWPCDLLLIIALKHYVDILSPKADALIHKRNVALVALGLRTMQRPGKLGNLTLKDIKWQDNRTLWVQICKSKTNQFKNGRYIPVKNIGSKYYTVRLLEQYLEIQSKMTAKPPLFLSKQRKKISVLAIGSVVKRFAEHAGLNGKFTAHLLQIGGAMAAMTASINLTQIQAIGGWDSKAVMLYLRTQSLSTIPYCSTLTDVLFAMKIVHSIEDTGSMINNNNYLLVNEVT
ncbi:8283_t:CDS:10, partial [Cetraspora pellucida]